MKGSRFFDWVIVVILAVLIVAFSYLFGFCVHKMLAGASKMWLPLLLSAGIIVFLFWVFVRFVTGINLAQKRIELIELLIETVGFQKPADFEKFISGTKDIIRLIEDEQFLKE